MIVLVVFAAVSCTAFESSSPSGGANPTAPTGDGGSAADGGAPCNGVLDCERVVFVTSQTFTGNLGGVAGADARCAEAAAQGNARVRGRAYHAWISDRGNAAAVRVTHGTGRYVTADGKLVANSLPEVLTSAKLLASPTNESGVGIGGPVWTGTSDEGIGYVSLLCEDWTTDSATATGGFGQLESPDSSHWTAAGGSACNTTAHLYCFED